MDYILFLVYGSIFCWLLTKIRFIADAGIGKRVILLLFIVKVLAGCVNGFIALRLSGTPDSIMYNRFALEEYHLLFSHPYEYFTNIFQSNYGEQYGTLFGSYQSYWNDLDTNLMIKFLSVCDIFSRGNYYINVIFYNFFVFFGGVALYRFFSLIFKEQRIILVITCFLLPSLLYFGSAIHKDGVIISGISFFLLYFTTSLQRKTISLKSFLILFFSLSVIFLIRNYVFFALIPAAFALLLSFKMKFPAWAIFSVVYITGTFLFFMLPDVSKKLDFPNIIVQKQTDFKELEKGGTHIEVNTLEPNFTSFARNAPQAINHTLMRPYITEMHLSRLVLPLAVELLGVLFLILLMLFFRNGQLAINFSHPLILTGLFFSFSMLLIIGYTVPNIGAIVRYRSIYLPFIITPVLYAIDWKKISSLIQFKK